jgi:glucokinase
MTNHTKAATSVHEQVAEGQSSTPPVFAPRLLGDIGGTNARFGWQAHPNAPIEYVQTLPCAEFDSLFAAMQHYLCQSALPAPVACAFGIACAVAGDFVRMTNHHWAFSMAELKRDLGVQDLRVINDFTALALALPSIPSAHLFQLIAPQRAQAMDEPQALALIGAGTGLGVSGLLPVLSKASTPLGAGRGRSSATQWLPIAGEGGHITLAAQTDLEHQVLNHIRQRFEHAAAERVLSGQGLVNLYQALRDIQGLHQGAHASPDWYDASDITQAALVNQEDLALQCLDMFAGFLGGAAGDLALTLGARGGVYIGGGIAPRCLPWLAGSSFAERFLAKGRYRTYVQDIPVWVITAPSSPALLGAATALGGG